MCGLTRSQNLASLPAVQVGPCLADLSRTALDPEVDPASVGEAKLLLRCVGALLRKHVLLLPDLSVTLIETLLAGCNTNRCGARVLGNSSVQGALHMGCMGYSYVDPILHAAQH